MAAVAVENARSWSLDTGNLRLSITHCVEPFTAHSLLDAGSRNNPKRGFVFVSRVLGKHIGASPGSMRRAQRELAGQIDQSDRSPVVFIGMAETAVGLGEGVFAAWQELHGPNRPAMYFSTTRYYFEGHDRVRFEEAHTHAPELYLYLPDTQAMRQLFRDATHVVLIDDEISTGNTLGNLVTALQQSMPSLVDITAVALTDFSGGRAQTALARPGIRQAQVTALLSGSFEFDVQQTFPLPHASVSEFPECRRHLIPNATARFGRCHATSVPDKLLDGLLPDLADASLVRVIATGEYMFPAQALGWALEEHGLNVLVHSTTRSPLRLDGAIGSITEIPDAYEEPVRYYIYNLPDDPAAGEIRLLVHEVPAGPAIEQICQCLQARSVCL